MDDDVLIRDLRRIYNDRDVPPRHRETARRAIDRIASDTPAEEVEQSTATTLHNRDEEYLRIRGIEV